MTDLGTLSFTKVSGTGNTFVVVDLRDGQNHARLTELEKKVSRRDFVRRLCSQHSGLGTDGALFLLKASEASRADVEWDFYNSDGTSAEMCGNAARCVGRLELRRSKNPEIKILTAVGVVVAKADGIQGDISIEMPIPKVVSESLAVGSGKEQSHSALINSGVPHIVIESDGLSDEQQMALVKAGRWAPEAGSNGANVTFFERLDRGRVRAKSFERGVEAFTLACGTGAMAVARVVLGGSDGRLDLELPGGFVKVEQRGQTSIYSGHVAIVCEGKFFLGDG